MRIPTTAGRRQPSDEVPITIQKRGSRRSELKHHSADASLLRSGLLARNNFRLARHPTRMGHKRWMKSATFQNGTAVQRGEIRVFRLRFRLDAILGAALSWASRS